MNSSQHVCKNKCMNFTEGCCWCKKIRERRVYVDGVGLFSPIVYKQFEFRVRRDIYFCSQCSIITFPERDKIVKEIHDLINEYKHLINEFSEMIYQIHLRNDCVSKLAQYIKYNNNQALN